MIYSTSPRESALPPRDTEDICCAIIVSRRPNALRGSEIISTSSTCNAVPVSKARSPQGANNLMSQQGWGEDRGGGHLP